MARIAKSAPPTKIETSKSLVIPELKPSEYKKEYRRLFRENYELKEKFHCHLCGSFKKGDEFYKSTDARSLTGVTPICKECAHSIMHRRDENGDDHLPTKESLIEALRYLDKPFYEFAYEQAMKEAEDQEQAKNFAKSYMRIISSKKYDGKNFLDSDIFRDRIIYTDEILVRGNDEEITAFQQFERDKADVLRLMGYDPFAGEAASDMPFLYSQMLGMLDSSEDANEDIFKIQSIVTIVRSFLQIKKIDDSIGALMDGYASTAQNANAIQKLQDSKQKIQTVIKNLAAESCISLKNSRNASKGENTWTGKIKKIKDLNLREAEVNGFDIETCRGMQQVMDMSNRSIVQALKLAEDELSDMVAEQREMIVNLQKKADSNEEIARILLRENLDLKDFISEKGLSINTIDLEDLFSKYGGDDGV